MSKDCISIVKAALGKDVSDEMLDEIFTTLDQRARTKARENPLHSKERVFSDAAAELAAEKKLAALIERRNQEINASRRTERQEFYSGFKNEADAISAVNVGKEGNLTGSANSVDAQHKGLADALLGPMIAELRKGGLLDVLKRRSAEFEQMVAREMARLNEGRIDPTGNKYAEGIAKIFNKYVEAARVMENDAGAYIRKEAGYITRQSHNQMRIVKAGADEWVSFIRPLLDERTFEGATDPDAFLRKVWANLGTGEHNTPSSDWLGGFKGPGNLAKKMSAERVLHFKGPDEWLEYNNRFGTSSLFESVVAGLNKAARNTALMRTWGTNPEAAFQHDIAMAIEQAKARGDLKTVSRLGGWKIQAEFDAISGKLGIARNIHLADAAQTTRNLISMAKLGGVVLSSIPDIAVRAAAMRHNGIGLLESYGNAFRSLLEGFGTSAEKKEVSDLLNAGTQGLLGSVFNRFHATDDVPGRMTKIMNTFFKANLLQWWTDAMEEGVGFMLSRNLANNAGRDFASLDGRFQTTLRRYGIEAAEWEVIRKAKTMVAEGEHYITPDALRHIEDAHFSQYLGNDDAAAVKGAKFDLESKLRAYIAEQIDEAMTVGGARERALVTFGTQAGTPMGEAVRFLMQFKSFPITYTMRSVGRELFRDGVDKTGLAHLMVATTALGYLAMTAKDAVKGRSARKPETVLDGAKIFAAAMQQGGGLGIYGDFLFGDYNRQGGGGVVTLAGPAVGTVDEWSRVFGAIKEAKDPRATAVRATVNSMPFANLFYTRMAMDYLFLYAVQENLNPGYLRRYEQRVKKENGQDFWLRPSSALLVR